MTTSTVDRLVADYLARLDAASAPLPPDRRSELLEEIGGHIAGARAAGAAADEAAVRTLLDRLGPPEVIVAAAMDDGPGPPPAPLQPPGTGLELCAVLLLTAGSFVPVVGWLAGAALLWSSGRWRTGEKLLGTLVVPLGPGGVLLLGGLLSTRVCAEPVTVQPVWEPDGPAIGLPGPLEPAVLECSGFALPPWLGAPLLVVAVVAPVVVAAWLYRRARSRAAQEAPVPLSPFPGSGWGGLEIAAVLLLALGTFVLPVVGPLIGLVLAWCSPRWTGREKGIATALALVPAALLLVLPLGGLLIARFAL